MNRLFGLTALVLVAWGCGSSTSTTMSPINGTDGSFLTCATETRAQPYQAGMQVASASGALIVKLVSSVPGPPVKGTNTWTIEVDAADTGAAVDGVNVVVAPYMPDHAHGTNPVGVTPAGVVGTYTLMPVYLYMSGYWEVRMTLGGAPVDAGIDSAMIPICIP